MLQRQMSSEKPDRLSAVRSDEGLKDLLRIYLAEPGKAHPESEAGPPDLRPALLGPYRDLETIRHDFPVVLVTDNADTPIVSLATIVDGILDRTAPAGIEGERLRRHLYRLETSIKRLAEKKPRLRLSQLWSLASTALVRQSENSDRLRASLEAAAEALPHDGWLLACGTRSTRQMFEHAWRPLQSERAVREREVLDELIARLSEVLESERARSVTVGGAAGHPDQPRHARQAKQAFARRAQGVAERARAAAGGRRQRCAPQARGATRFGVRELYRGRGSI